MVVARIERLGTATWTRDLRSPIQLDEHLVAGPLRFLVERRAPYRFERRTQVGRLDISPQRRLGGHPGPGTSLLLKHRQEHSYAVGMRDGVLLGVVHVADRAVSDVGVVVVSPAAALAVAHLNLVNGTFIIGVERGPRGGKRKFG